MYSDNPVPIFMAKGSGSSRIPRDEAHCLHMSVKAYLSRFLQYNKGLGETRHDERGWFANQYFSDEFVLRTSYTDSGEIKITLETMNGMKDYTSEMSSDRLREYLRNRRMDFEFN